MKTLLLDGGVILSLFISSALRQDYPRAMRESLIPLFSKLAFLAARILLNPSVGCPQ